MALLLTAEFAALARRLATAFRAADHEIFLVGGAVRDALLNRAVSELDFATSARPETTVRILAYLDSREPYRIGEKFGTVGADIAGIRVEITTYRSQEQYAASSRKPETTFGNSLEEDLARRDFTINAMALDPLTERTIDPFAGLTDLEMRRIRSVGKPDERFSDDPLRLLRAIRFATALHFEIEADTWLGLQATSFQLRTISRERVRDEFSKMVTGSAAVRSLELLRDAGLLQYSASSLSELQKMSNHGPRHPLSLWDHTMRVVDGVPPKLHLRWAALLHDVAKPATRTTEVNGRPRFFHHEEIGAGIARQQLVDLRYPGRLVHDVGLLVDSHMQLHAYSDEWSDGAVRRLAIRLGGLLPDAIVLARADAAGHTTDGHSQNEAKLDRLEQRFSNLDNTSVTALKSPLSGDDLIARYGRSPGPWIKEVKALLLDEVLEGRLQPDDRSAAWRLADAILSDHT